jgi:hypothetical protein
MLKRDYHSGDKIIDAMMTDKQWRTLIPDTKGTGLGAYAAVVLNSFTANQYLQSLMLVGSHLDDLNKKSVKEKSPTQHHNL